MNFYASDNKGVVCVMTSVGGTYRYWNEIWGDYLNDKSKKTYLCPTIQPAYFMARNFTYGICYRAIDYPTSIFDTVSAFSVVRFEKFATPSALAMGGESVWQYPSGYTSGSIVIKPGWTQHVMWQLCNTAGNGNVQFRHSNRTNAMYGDGHVSSSGRPEFAREAKARAGSSATSISLLDRYFVTYTYSIN